MSVPPRPPFATGRALLLCRASLPGIKGPLHPDKPPRRVTGWLLALPLLRRPFGAHSLTHVLASRLPPRGQAPWTKTHCPHRASPRRSCLPHHLLMCPNYHVHSPLVPAAILPAWHRLVPTAHLVPWVRTYIRKAPIPFVRSRHPISTSGKQPPRAPVFPQPGSSSTTISRPPLSSSTGAQDVPDLKKAHGADAAAG
jgi:hypothetical protein